MTAVTTTFLGEWHSGYVGQYRKAAKVPCESSVPRSGLHPYEFFRNYVILIVQLDPNAYVTHAEAQEDPHKFAFNCAQRAHANYLEHQPQVVIPMLIAGLRYPLLSAAAGVAWCIARVMYTLGYVKNKKKQGRGRTVGVWYVAPELLLQGAAAWTGWQMLSG